MGSEILVDLQEVYFKRGKRTIFSNLSLKVESEQIVGLIGPSGAGKTTTLSLIGGQIKPNRGKVVIDGQNIPDLNRQSLFHLRQKMGMMFQNSALFTNLSVFENVAFPLREHTSLPEDMIRLLVLVKLQAVGLRGASRLMPSELSGGMARRVALARAIALDPQLVMYDEPFTGLDPITKAVIVKLIKRLHDAMGLTSILVSHDIHETLSIADYIYLIADGHVIAQGKPEDLQDSKCPQVAQFIQGLPDGVVPFHYPAIPYEEDLLS